METGFLVVVSALFGLVVGSFMTVVIERVPEGRSIVRPRSTCPRCGTEIENRDNIPVVRLAAPAREVPLVRRTDLDLPTRSPNS